MNAIFAKQLGCLFFLLLFKLYTVVRTLFAFQTDDNFVLKIIKIIVNLLRQIGLEGHYDFNFVQIYVRLLPLFWMLFAMITHICICTHYLSS